MMAHFQETDVRIGERTACMILNDIAVQWGFTLYYKLVSTRGEPHDPIFAYTVSLREFTGVGEASTKQNAKQEAAVSILKNIKKGNELPAQYHKVALLNYDESPVNFVGMLNDFCVRNRIPCAKYTYLSATGPPHMRNFKMDCKLLSYSEVGFGRSLKQSKQEAARKMMSRAKEIFQNKDTADAGKSVDNENLKEPSNFRDIENRTFCHEKSIYLTDMLNLFAINEELTVPQEFLNLAKNSEKFYEQLRNPKQFVDILVKKLGGICNTTTTPKFLFVEVLEKKIEAGKSVNSTEEVSTETLTGNDAEALITKFNVTNWLNDGKEAESNDWQIRIFLTVVCPLGVYVFPATASDIDMAERKAAVHAIKCFRLMALLSVSKEKNIK